MTRERKEEMDLIRIRLKMEMKVLIIHNTNQKAHKDLDQNGKTSIIDLY